MYSVYYLLTFIKYFKYSWENVAYTAKTFQLANTFLDVHSSLSKLCAALPEKGRQSRLFHRHMCEKAEIPVWSLVIELH